jgi:hypothetical protein
MFATTRNIWALEKAGKDVNHKEEIIVNTFEYLLDSTFYMCYRK